MLGREWWGRGLAREAAAAAISWGLGHFEFQTVVGNTHPENLRSQRILLSLGMVFEEDWTDLRGALRLFRATRAQFEQALAARPT